MQCRQAAHPTGYIHNYIVPYFGVFGCFCFGFLRKKLLIDINRHARDNPVIDTTDARLGV